MSLDEPKAYDVVVIGSGTGQVIVNLALQAGLKVALIDKGPVGGTCPSLGCFPTKILTYAADRVVEAQENAKFGIKVPMVEVDVFGIMERMRAAVRHSQQLTRDWIARTPQMDFYEAKAEFVDPHTLEVGGRLVRGSKIFVVAGARPLIPPIENLEGVGYLTNESLLQLEERPESVIIIGGGYIAAELGHFLASMGSQVTILEVLERLLGREEPEVSALAQEIMGRRMEIWTRMQPLSVVREGAYRRLMAKDLASGQERAFVAEQILVAVGRRSNADLLQADRAGIELTKTGYVKANDYLETNVPHIWASGDILGKDMLLHVSHREAELAWHNSLGGDKIALNYRVVPHAVFAHPQIASVGLTEAAARENHDVRVGVAYYRDTDMGEAMLQEQGFAKAVIDAQTGIVLGFHIIGPYAPMLIQEVVNVMAGGCTATDIAEALHIHPSLTKLVLHAIQNANGPS